MDPISENFPIRITRSSRGFGLILILSLMPLIISLSLVVLIMGAGLNIDQRLKKICRDQLITAQQKSGASMTRLLFLNPVAKNLRIKKRMTEIAYAPAVASGNKVLALRLRAELAEIQLQRQQVDLQQKMILRQQTLTNWLALQQAKSHLRSALDHLIQPGLFDRRILFPKLKHVSLAVTPDLPDIAPIYELKTPFEEEQTLSLFWNWSVQSRSESLRRYPLSFQRECSVTLTKRKNQWSPLLRTDKLLLKDFSPFSSFSASFL